MNNSKKHAVVVANGEYPSHAIPLKLIEKAPFLISCDGAADVLIEKGIIPNIIIGDGDSISDKNKAKYQSILHIIDEQETNDLTKAISFLLSHHFTDITIVGATGKREDHTLGNISLLIEYKQKCNIKMVTDHGIFYPCINKFEIDLNDIYPISIINFGAKNLKSSGLAYPIRDFSNWWQGTLNKNTEKKVTIDAVGPFLIYIAF